MTQANELERLEAVVAKLLTKYEELRQEKLRLEDEVATREMEIEDLQQLLETAKADRGDVTARVEGLLGQIEDWEASLEDESKASQENEEDLDESNDDDDEEEESEPESRVQHNLFNVDSQVQSNMG